MTPVPLAALLDSEPHGADPPTEPVPADIVTLIDASGSTFGPSGTDPAGIRFAAVRAFASLMALLHRGVSDRLGVTLFGTSAPPEASSGLQRVTPGLADSLAVLDHATDLGNTNFAAGIQRAGALFATPNLTRDRHLVIVTDGIPDLGDGRPPLALIPDIRAALAALPTDVKVHLLVVGDDEGWSRTQLLWEPLGLTSMTRLAANDQLLDAALDIIRPDLGLERISAGPTPPDGTIYITVPGATDRLIVSVVHAGLAGSAKLVDPNGRRAGARRDDRGSTLLAVGGPRPGVWTASGLPTGVVVVESVPVKLRVVQIAPQEPLGRALQPELVLTTPSGAPPSLPVQRAPRQLHANLSGPDGHQTSIRFDMDGPGRWTARSPVQVAATGRYTLAATDPNVGSLLVGFTVIATPHLQVTLAPLTAGTPARVTARLQLGTARWSAPTGTLVDAELRGGSGRILEQTSLRLVDRGRQASGEFTTRPQEGCRYRLRVAMQTPTGITDQWTSRLKLAHP